MNDGIRITLSIIELVFISLVISIDNAILIGSLTKDLPEKERKISDFFGALLGLFLRIILVLAFYFILNSGKDGSTIPVIYIVGGILIVFVGLTITNKKDEEKIKTVSPTAGILKAIFTIFLVDAMLSLDNSIIVAQKSNELSSGEPWWEIFVMIIVTLISFPVILYGAGTLGTLMKKNKWIVYVASVLLVSVGINMFLEDPVLGIELDSWIIFIINITATSFLVVLKWFLFEYLLIMDKIKLLSKKYKDGKRKE